MRQPVKGLTIGMAAAVCLLTACAQESSSSAGAAAVVVDVVGVQAERYVPMERLVGRANASRRAEVRARSAGILLAREYQEGSDVAAGQLLFRIDPAPLQAAVNERAARLARARAERDNAQARADRLAGLVDRQLASVQSRDDAQAALRIARAEQAEAEAALQRAQLELSWSEVQAPIAGRAGRAEVTEGALVGEDSATRLTVIEQIDPLYIDSTVPASAWPRLRALIASEVQPRVILFDGGGERLAEVDELGFVDFAADPGTGAIALRLTMPNSELRLLPGMMVELQVALPAIADAILIDAGAILRDARGSYVYIVNDAGKAERRELQLGEQVGPRWRVLDGLTGGERLITTGLLRLRPGADVRGADVPAADAQGSDGEGSDGPDSDGQGTKAGAA